MSGPDPKPPNPPEGLTFRQAFCHRYRCKAESFERRLLTSCFPILYRLPVAIWLVIRPESFAREMALLSRLSLSTEVSHLRSELEGYAYENERDKPARVAVFGFRLSRRRCLRIFREVMRGPDARE